MSHLIDKRIGNEVEGEIISDIFDGYVFKITGGLDRDGFGMKNGVLTTERKRLLLKRGSQGIRMKKFVHRKGCKIRKLVRGCIISPEIKMVNLKIVKSGNKPIPGLSAAEDAIPRRLAAKKATKILKEFGLFDIYNKKKANHEERKTLRYMITKFTNKREVTTANGKVYTKRPKVQRLITPLRLRRKRVIKKIKEENVKYTAEQKKSYEESYKKLRNKKTSKAKKAHKK
jgi:small subunit ribosomal protein S6e